MFSAVDMAYPKVVETAVNSIAVCNLFWSMAFLLVIIGVSMYVIDNQAEPDTPTNETLPDTTRNETLPCTTPNEPLPGTTTSAKASYEQLVYVKMEICLFVVYEMVHIVGGATIFLGINERSVQRISTCALINRYLFLFKIAIVIFMSIYISTECLLIGFPTLVYRIVSIGVLEIFLKNLETEKDHQHVRFAVTNPQQLDAVEIPMFVDEEEKQI